MPGVSKREIGCKCKTFFISPLSGRRKQTISVRVFSFSAATAAAKSLQSCPTLRPHRRRPTRLPRPWDSPGNNTGVGCHFLLQCMKVKSESEVAQSCPTLSDPWTAAHQAPPSMGVSRQEFWSGVPFPSELLFPSL